MKMSFFVEEIVICPFTGKALIPVAEKQLASINDKIEKGELYFYQGAIVKNRIQQAYTSSNFLYIYIVHNGILLLKKETAIVPRSRVANPYHKNVQICQTQPFPSL